MMLYSYTSRYSTKVCNKKRTHRHTQTAGGIKNPSFPYKRHASTHNLAMKYESLILCTC